MPSFNCPLPVQCGGGRLSVSLAPAPQDFSTSKAFSPCPRTVLTENICRCVQHIRVSLTHPMQALLFCGEFLLHIPCWLLFLIWGVSLTHPMLASFSNLGSFSYTSHAGFFFNLRSFSYTSRAAFTFIWRLSLTHPMQALLFSGEFLWHIPCWLLFFSFFNLGVSLTHPVLALLLSFLFF